MGGAAGGGGGGRAETTARCGACIPCNLDLEVGTVHVLCSSTRELITCISVSELTCARLCF